MPADPFYGAQEWKELRRACLRRDGYACKRCGASVRGLGLSRVNHVLSRRARPDLALSLGNLETLCIPCDNKHHAEKGAGDRKPVKADGMPSDPAHHWNKR